MSIFVWQPISCFFVHKTFLGGDILGKLTEKRKRFADEYIIDLNGTRAYKVAYPSVKKDSVAAANAVRLLRDDKVKAYIEENLKKIKDARIADTKEVMEYLSSVMRGKQTESVATAKGIYEDVEVSAKDRIKAAELIGKRYGAWTDKKEINGNLTIDIGIGDYDADN